MASLGLRRGRSRLFSLIVLASTASIALLVEAKKKKKNVGDGAAAKTPPIPSDTWAAAATSMFGQTPHGSEGVFMELTNEQVPYTHWACFRQSPPLPANVQDRLRCCQQIYRIMEAEHSLCWKKNGCQSAAATDRKNKLEHGKAEFLHYCAEQLVALPDGGSSSPEDDDGTMRARFSLVLPGDSPVEDSRLDMWRQCVSFEESKGHPQYFYEVRSPVRLAVDPTKFFKEERNIEAKKKQRSEASSGAAEEEETAAATISKNGGSLYFGANINTRVSGDLDEDDEARDLNHLMSVAVSDEAADLLNRQGSKWKAELEVLLFLPEELDVKKSDPFSQCEVSTSASDVWEPCQCSLFWKDYTTAAATTSKKRKVWSPQQAVRLIHVTFEPGNLLEKKEKISFITFTLKWTTRLLIVDDDLLLPSPVVHGGAVIDTSNDQNVLLKWDAGKSVMSRPLSTVLLEDSAKSEL